MNNLQSLNNYILNLPMDIPWNDSFALQCKFIADRLSYYESHSKKWMTIFLEQVKEFMKMNAYEIHNLEWQILWSHPICIEKDWETHEFRSMNQAAVFIGDSRANVNRALKKWYKCKWWKILP